MLNRDTVDGSEDIICKASILYISGGYWDFSNIHINISHLRPKIARSMDAMTPNKKHNIHFYMFCL